MRWRTVAIVIASLVLASPAFAQVQTTTGVIQGTVTDATGAVMAGVTVEVKNIDTNTTESRVTDANGRFVVLQLPPGRYTVTFRLQGFSTVVQEGIVLTVGQAVSLSPRLAVSTVQETVTVVGTPIVETTRSGVASTLDERVVATLPILGRKFEDLLTLTAGVSVVQGPDGDEISFAGQRGVFNNISLDGGDYNNGFFGEQAGGQRAPIDITLDAVKEFQVIATGAPAEFGRTAGGVVNVVTKSGTNTVRGSLFHFQRLEGLTGELSDGSSLLDFHREQFGGTIGGPVKRDKSFYFAALEGITGDFTRLNLGQPIGTPCPITNPTIGANEGLINDSPDCQRRALLSFMQTQLGQDESLPIPHPIKTVALLLKNDVTVNASNRVGISYNFNHSRKENETFDVATYGTSANGIEGDPARINVLNANWFTTLSATRLNEFHFTYSREARPRRANQSNLAADTGMGFSPSFRFGDPYFLQPTVDELIWRTQFKDNVSWITGAHTIKVGGEWIHTLNDQIFRGFFTGRYLFDSVSGFLRYASPSASGGFGPSTIGCTGGVFVTAPTLCPAGTTPSGGPLLFYLQSAGRSGPATDATGASTISNEEYGLFIQDQWQVQAGLTVNYGLRWDAQIMPETVDPTTTAYAPFLNDPTFPSDGTIPNQTNMWQPRAGMAWDVKRDGKSVIRANFGVFSARQNMLTQVGSVTTNGVQQQSIYVDSGLHRQFGAPTPTWPGILTPAPVAAGAFPDFSGVRVFHRDYENPRIYSANVSYEQEFMPEWAAYVDFIWTKGTNLSRFLNYNRSDPVCCDQPGFETGNVYRYLVAPFSPRLGEVMVATSLGRSLYRGLTLGIRKRFADKYQLEANYVLAKDEDDDSNERDPFTDRSFNFFDLEKDYGPSDRDIRHKFNFFGFFELPHAIGVNVRAQYRSAQPITASPRSLNGEDRGRNGLRKDNEYFSLDWRLMRSFRFGTHYEIIPTLEMFNTFNNANNINPLTTPALFDFSGFLRTGVGDPRQVQLAVKFVF
jgi:carboxypeptidase family protein/TonB-dependent receptor-like protein